MFQPTRPHGARQPEDILPQVHRLFQPTRPHGARPSLRLTSSPRCSFNPRARMGRDSMEAMFRVSLKKFQPTRPHGARHMYLIILRVY